MASPVEPHARIEHLTVLVGERFPLAFHDEVLVVGQAALYDEGSDSFVNALSLTVLRRGL